MVYNQAMSRRLSPDIESELSQRELQLLVLASRGLTDQAIAIELGISLATIATYWGRIRIKLGPLNRTELVAKYLDAKAREGAIGLESEITLLKSQLAATKEQDVELLIALNKVPRVIVVLDINGTIIYANEGACRAFGYLASEIIGRHFLEIYPEGRHDLWHTWRENFVSNPLDPNFARHRRAYVRHKDGHIVEVIGDGVLYDAPGGQRIMWVAEVADEVQALTNPPSA